MDEVSKSGRTVLFVNHNLAAVRQLCSSAICIDGGRIKKIGTVNEVVKFYDNMKNEDIFTCKKDIGKYVFKNHPMKYKKSFGIVSALLLVNGEPSDVIESGQDVEILLEYSSDRDLIAPELGILIKNSEGVSFIGLNNKHIGLELNTIKNKYLKTTISIKRFPIYGDSEYYINLYFGDVGNYYEILHDAMKFELKTSDVYNSGRILDNKFNLLFHDKISFLNG